jgi:hypothetical protein
VLLGKEANPVMKALRDDGIQVTALHTHMLTEEPRLFLMHFWANHDAANLARGLRAALDQANSKKQSRPRLTFIPQMGSQQLQSPIGNWQSAILRRLA